VDFEVTIGILGGSLRVTIPLPLAKHLGLKRGDTVLMSLIEPTGTESSKAILLEKKAK
jgi:bifunctional DNA-binding transcriptional regulator/antitoxin component of YhaV-PrlF toxin-antitoxin module